MRDDALGVSAVIVYAPRLSFLPRPERPGTIARPRRPFHDHVLFDPLNGCFWTVQPSAQGPSPADRAKSGPTYESLTAGGMSQYDFATTTSCSSAPRATSASVRFIDSHAASTLRGCVGRSPGVARTSWKPCSPRRLECARRVTCLLPVRIKALVPATARLNHTRYRFLQALSLVRELGIGAASTFWRRYSAILPVQSRAFAGRSAFAGRR